MNGHDAQDIANLAATLAHPLRVRLLDRLARGPANVGDLIDAFGEEQTVVSKHLASLRAAGLLRCRPEGRCRVYEATVSAAVAAVLVALATVAREAAAHAGAADTARA
ncbi:MAG TPA: metalloregulator ArsR/SmtB family transcription factor [Myxococcota bacterium]|jgi:ArsR family transcriptional regulator|nr:metalloregulator ArsR/SmtB family transcription factor [Myxococcota bacterium]